MTVSNFLAEANMPDFIKTVIACLIRIVLAMLIGGVIGMERGKQGRAAGMRTHILVCLGATLCALCGTYASTVLGFTGDPLRISAQVISGIGFLGVGTILIKGRFQITGLTTAAGLWTVAAIGLAIGIGFYEGAIITFICTIMATTILHKIEYRIKHRYTRMGIYIEIKSVESVRKIVDYLIANFEAVDIQVTAARSSTPGNVGIETILLFKTEPECPSHIFSDIEKLDDVVFAIESI